MPKLMKTFPARDAQNLDSLATGAQEVPVDGDTSYNFKDGLYRIWCGVNRLGDSGVNTLGDTSAFVNPAG